MIDQIIYTILYYTVGGMIVTLLLFRILDKEWRSYTEVDKLMGAIGGCILGAFVYAVIEFKLYNLFLS